MPGCFPARAVTGTPVSWMPYAYGSLAIHTFFTLLYNISNFRQMDLIGRLCFFLYIAILAIYALLLLSIEKFGQERYLYPLNAFARIATLLCLGVALPNWTVESGSCLPDFLRYLLLSTGVIALIFNTLFLPLPGWWQLPVHVTTTAIFVHWHSNRVCNIILDHPSNTCDYRQQFAAVWPSILSVARTLSGLLYAYIDEEKLEKLDMYGQCQVSVVWIQLSLGGLFPCLLQCMLGFDRTLHRFLDDVPGCNKVFVYAAMTLQLLGLLWRASYFWGVSLLQQKQAISSCKML